MYTCSFILFLLFFFFKQKTAYEMRISDWSSDMCSSDLGGRAFLAAGADAFGPVADHARQLRGLDLLVPPPEIGEAGGEDGAGFDLIVAPAKAGAAGGVAQGCQRPPPSRGRRCYKRSLSYYAFAPISSPSMTRARVLLLTAALGPLDSRVPRESEAVLGSVVVAPLGPRRMGGGG